MSAHELALLVEQNRWHHPGPSRRLLSADLFELCPFNGRVMDHLSDLDLARFAKAMGAVGDKDLGPAARRAPQPAS